MPRKTEAEREQAVAKRHAALARQRSTPEAIAKRHAENRQALIKDMGEATKELEATPDSQEWTLQDLDNLESLRDAALSLAREVEAIFAVINGHD